MSAREQQLQYPPLRHSLQKRQHLPGKHGMKSKLHCCKIVIGGKESWESPHRGMSHIKHRLVCMLCTHKSCALTTCMHAHEPGTPCFRGPARSASSSASGACIALTAHQPRAGAVQQHEYPIAAGASSQNRVGTSVVGTLQKRTCARAAVSMARPTASRAASRVGSIASSALCRGHSSMNPACRSTLPTCC